MYDHSEDQQQKDTILLNYCIDDIEGMCKVDSILSQGFAQFCQALGWAWSEVGWCGLVLAWSDQVFRIIGTGVDLVFVMVMGVINISQAPHPHPLPRPELGGQCP